MYLLLGRGLTKGSKTCTGFREGETDAKIDGGRAPREKRVRGGKMVDKGCQKASLGINRGSREKRMLPQGSGPQ